VERGGRYFWCAGFGVWGLLPNSCQWGFLHLDAVVLYGGLDVGEGLFALFIRDAFHLIETGYCIADVRCISQWLLAFAGEGVNVIGEFFPFCCG
jgi:hypothetical protein